MRIRNIRFRDLLVMHKITESPTSPPVIVSRAITANSPQNKTMNAPRTSNQILSHLIENNLSSKENYSGKSAIPHLLDLICHH